MTQTQRTAIPDPDSPLYGYLLDGARRRLVLAEDDAEMRRLLVQTLQLDGYEVDAVADGAALLDLIRGLLDGPADDDPPDLIVSDVRMPGWTGLEAIEVLRRNRCLTPVLLVTAFSDADVRRRARELDAIVLDKPFSMHELSRTVFELLSRKPGWGFAPGFEDDEEDDPYLAGWGPVRRRRRRHA